MKKGLIAGGILLGCVLLLSGIAAAVTFESVDVTIDATLEWTIFNEEGLMPEATKEEPSLAIPELTLSVGAWEASTEDAYIKYAAEVGTVSLNNSIGYDIYDLGAGVTEAQGVTLTTEMAALSADLVYTTDSEYGLGLGYTVKTAIVATEPTTVEVEVVDEETWAWVDDDENVETPPIWGHPMKTVEEEVEEEVTKEETVVGFGVKYNSTGAYGVEVVYPIAPITLTGQYGNDRADRTGYLAKAEYALAAGSVSVAYQKSLGDRTIVDAIDDAVAVMGDPFTRIIATLADIPITDTTTFKLEVVNQDLMDIDYAEGTTYVVETATTLAENVTFTINVKSAEETLSYFGKIGVAF